MKFLQYLEKAWIAAAVCSFIVTIYNFVTLLVFDNRVYFPLFCGVFCLLIFLNIRSQRKFREQMAGKKNTQQTK
jgi:hypothetical protein